MGKWGGFPINGGTPSSHPWRIFRSQKPSSELGVPPLIEPPHVECYGHLELTETTPKAWWTEETLGGSRSFLGRKISTSPIFWSKAPVQMIQMIIGPSQWRKSELNSSNGGFLQVWTHCDNAIQRTFSSVHGTDAWPSAALAQRSHLRPCEIENNVRNVLRDHSGCLGAGMAHGNRWFSTVSLPVCLTMIDNKE